MRETLGAIAQTLAFLFFVAVGIGAFWVMGQEPVYKRLYQEVTIGGEVLKVTYINKDFFNEGVELTLIDGRTIITSERIVVGRTVSECVANCP